MTAPPARGQGNAHSLRWTCGLVLGLGGFFGILVLPTPRGLESAAAKVLINRLPHLLRLQVNEGGGGGEKTFQQQKLALSRIRVAVHRNDGQLVPASIYEALPPPARSEFDPPRPLIALVGTLAGVAQRVLAVTVLMLCFWIFIVVPVPVTALLPLLLFPLLNIAGVGQATFPTYFSVGAQYGHHLIFLFMGTFMLSKAMIRWHLDQRIALHILGRFGGKPTRLLLGFILTSSFLSMWISNTACAAMMVPIALAVVERIEHQNAQRYQCGVLLAVAYGSSIGGIGTLVGSPPNAIFAGFASSLLGHSVSFIEWLSFGLPFVLIMLPLLWLVLAWRYVPASLCLPTHTAAAVGPMSRGERSVMTIFLLMVGLWLTRSPIHAIGWAGWSSLSLGSLQLGMVQDSGVALLGALLLFLVPVDLQSRTFVLDYKNGFDISWGTLILFGGGLALGQAMANSGIALWLAEHLSLVAGAGHQVLLLAVTAFASLLTEVTSNTASATVLMPIMYALGRSVGGGEMVFMASGAVACSLAFILPIATPPNAIVYGTGKVSMLEMFKTGVILDVVAVLVWWIVANLTLG